MRQSSSSGVAFLSLLLSLGGIINIIHMSRAKVVHYRNAVFNGQINNRSKEGTGILITDTRGIIIANFLQDKPHGRCAAFLSLDTYFLGSLKKGVLDGLFVIRSPFITIYSCFIDEQLSVELAVVNHEQSVARLWRLEQREAVCSDQVGIDGGGEAKALSAIAPSTEVFPDLKAFLRKQFRDSLLVGNFDKSNRFEVKLQDKSLMKCILRFQNERLISYGSCLGGELHGLGYINDRSFQFQGEMKGNQPSGQALRTELETGRSIYAKFVQGDLRKLEVAADKNEESILLVSKLKQRLHCHAIDFINDFVHERVIALLSSIFDSTYQNELRYKQQNSKRKIQSARVSERGTPSQSNKEKEGLASRINEYNQISRALKRK